MNGSARPRQLRVLVVDDSSLCRMVLKEILEADGDIAVVGEAGDGYEAIALAKAIGPDLITMDIGMPGPDGLEVIASIMARSPAPILVVTDERLGPGSEIPFRALQGGALDVLAKPSFSNNVKGEELRSRVRALAQIPVFRHVFEDEPGTTPGFGNGGMLAPALDRRARPRFVAIAAGAGGSNAVATVLRGLPSGFPCAIAVAQHTPRGFVEGYLNFLRANTELRVELAPREPVESLPGTVFIAPDDAHLVCPREGFIMSRNEALFQGCRPSATMLLRSVSDAYADAGVGVILSGLGDDGVAGASLLRQTGGLTIAVDSNSRPQGMPGAAVLAGVIDRVIPVELIADMLLAATRHVAQPTLPPPR